METSTSKQGYSKLLNKKVPLSIAFFCVFSFGIYLGYQSIPLISKTAALETAWSTKPESVDFTRFWKVWSVLDEKFPKAELVQPETRIDGAIKGLAESMGDPYTVFMAEKEAQVFSETISGEFSGIGAEIGMKDSIPTIVAPLKNSPAMKAGIRAGDRILKIQGEDVSKIPLDVLISRVRGEKGSTVTLTLFNEKSDTKPREVSVVRDTIIVPTVDYASVGDVFVVRLYTFDAKAITEFKKAMIAFSASKKEKMMLDLRGNPGGYLDAAVDIASYFLPEGSVVVREEFGDATKDEFRSKGYPLSRQNFKLAVLVDEGSASASEIVAGALKDLGRAQILGKKTYGKGSVQELVQIDGASLLKVTVANWFTPNGISISKNGVMPDKEIIPTEKDLKAIKEASRFSASSTETLFKKDPILTKALLLFKK
jgi:carboxyl-terminal processing protease